MNVSQTDAKAIGKRIRARREYLHRTQRQIADALSITPANYSKYEAGLVNISSQDLLTIAGLLRVKIGYLYGEDEGEPKSTPEIEYEAILDELNSASYSGGLESEDVSEIAEIIRMKARRKAERQGRA